MANKFIMMISIMAVIYPASGFAQAGEWKLTLVDSAPYVGRGSSIALASNGQPRISYVDSAYVKYAWYDGSWHTETLESIDPFESGEEYTSLFLDSNDSPHISYVNSFFDIHTHDIIRRLKYIWYDTAWHRETVDGTGVGFNSSLALDSEGKPRISYVSSGLKYAWYDTAWHRETVDGTSVGESISLALDSNGDPHISYYDYNNDDLKYAWYDGSWHTVTVDSTGDVGQHNSLALDSDNNPHISYCDFTNGDLKYAWYDGTWHTETVRGGGGFYTSLALDSDNNPHISYWSGGLKYAWYYGRWYTVTVDSGGGFYISLALDSDNNPHISYHDYTNSDLKYATLLCSNDIDCDGRLDQNDNCPLLYNPDQEDSDQDAIGDFCDNCIADSNPDQEDADDDTIGDICDECTDTDGDGYGNPGFDHNTCPLDNCPDDANPDQSDSDDDSSGDACDNCPEISNEDQSDVDEDGAGDVCDNCTDVPNGPINGTCVSIGECNYCPLSQADSDSDTWGDVCDTCPFLASPDQADSDGDGIGNVCDNCPDHINQDQKDADGDCLGDACDLFPAVYNSDQPDGDGDGIGDACDSAPSVPALLPAADGHYYHFNDYYDPCAEFGGSCPQETNITEIRDKIKVSYTYWKAPGYGSRIENGILEFDISSADALCEDEMNAELSLIVKCGSCDYLTLYNIADGNENGIIELNDLETEDAIVSIVTDLQPEDTITFDVTAAVAHDLFELEQSVFSGFVLISTFAFTGPIEFYDHTDPVKGPKLTVSYINDGDCITIDDNCPYDYNPLQEDSYPPGGNGCGDACECHADCNADQKVNLADLVIMKHQFMWNCNQHPSCEADCNYDGSVNLSDLVMMKNEFLRTDCPVCP